MQTITMARIVMTPHTGNPLPLRVTTTKYAKPMKIIPHVREIAEEARPAVRKHATTRNTAPTALITTTMDLLTARIRDAGGRQPQNAHILPNLLVMQTWHVNG